MKLQNEDSGKDSGSIRQKTFVTINILVVKAGVVAGGMGGGGYNWWQKSFLQIILNEILKKFVKNDICWCNS